MKNSTFLQNLNEVIFYFEIYLNLTSNSLKKIQRNSEFENSGLAISEKISDVKTLKYSTVVFVFS